jgi:carbonic anhydrase
VKKFIRILAVAIIGSVSTAASAAEWNHDPASPEGPESWGEVDPEYRTCGAVLTPGGPFVETGKRQSPIDIPSTTPVDSSLRRPSFYYKDRELEVENTGHVVEVTYGSGTGSRLVIGRNVYELQQFHFHAPSEHSVDGVHAAMEVHFVHANTLGELAVVGVFMFAAPQGNPVVDKIFDHAPLTEGPPNIVAGEEINARDLLPENKRNYITYAGSLTTPSCSEGVRWIVMTDSIQVSQATVDKYHSIIADFPGYDGFEDNNRPVRPLNGRPVRRRAVGSAVTSSGS